MITLEEYLEAKKIVDEYEQAEWEEGHRQAAAALNLEEEECDEWGGTEDCEVCGGQGEHHYKGCIYNDPLAYNEVGYG